MTSVRTKLTILIHYQTQSSYGAVALQMYLDFTDCLISNQAVGRRAWGGDSAGVAPSAAANMSSCCLRCTNFNHKVCGGARSSPILLRVLIIRSEPVSPTRLFTTVEWDIVLIAKYA